MATTPLLIPGPTEDQWKRTDPLGGTGSAGVCLLTKAEEGLAKGTGPAEERKGAVPARLELGPPWHAGHSSLLPGPGRTGRRASGAHLEALWPKGREAKDQCHSPTLSPQRLRPFHLNSVDRGSPHCTPGPSLEPGGWLLLSPFMFLSVPLVSGTEGLEVQAPLSSFFQRLPSKLEMCLVPPAE